MFGFKREHPISSGEIKAKKKKKKKKKLVSFYFMNKVLKIKFVKGKKSKEN